MNPITLILPAAREVLEVDVFINFGSIGIVLGEVDR
jgi:hypothetical protein